MDLRVAQASAVIVQHVPPSGKEQFLEWQRGIARIVENFAGYAGTDIYPPGEGSDEWVIVQHFDDDDALQAWLRAPERERWVQRIQSAMGKGQTTQLPGGFGAWFTQRMHDSAPPAGWKMALAVLLGLYPTVMLLTLYFPGPFTRSWSLATAMLLGNALSVSALQWLVMPVLNKALGPWLQADCRRDARVFYTGLIAIFVALTMLCAGFRALSG